MIQHLLGKIALQSNDWRGTIDQIRMLSEYTVKNIKSEGSEGLPDSSRYDVAPNSSKGISWRANRPGDVPLYVERREASGSRVQSPAASKEGVETDHGRRVRRS